MKKELTQYLIIDWQSGSTRTRKSKPSQSDLGTHEIVTDLNLDIVIPEVDVPSIEAEIEVPQPRVEGAEAESLDADELDDSRSESSGASDSVASDDGVDSRSESTVTSDTRSDDLDDWKDYADELVEETFDIHGQDVTWEEHGPRLVLEVLEDLSASQSEADTENDFAERSRDVPSRPDPSDVRSYVSDRMYAVGFEREDTEVVA